MTDQEKFNKAVMNWISEATSMIHSLDGSEGGRRIMADACEKCWTASDAMNNHDAGPAATAQMGKPDLHGTGNTQKPVAWMVARNGEPCRLSWTLGDARGELNRLELVSTGTPALELFSLYRSPTLTDAEREAIEWYADFPNGIHAATLRNLLERTIGK